MRNFYFNTDLFPAIFTLFLVLVLVFGVLSHAGAMTDEQARAKEEQNAKLLHIQQLNANFLISGTDYVFDYTFNDQGTCIKVDTGKQYCGTFTIEPYHYVQE